MTTNKSGYETFIGRKDVGSKERMRIKLGNGDVYAAEHWAQADTDDAYLEALRKTGEVKLSREKGITDSGLEGKRSKTFSGTQAAYAVSLFIDGADAGKDAPTNATTGAKPNASATGAKPRKGRKGKGKPSAAEQRNGAAAPLPSSNGAN